MEASFHLISLYGMEGPKEAVALYPLLLLCAGSIRHSQSTSRHSQKGAT